MPSAISLDRGLHRGLVDGLYLEAMLMADEARSYFDGRDVAEDGMDDPLRRVAFACESLKVTTRLMHIIAWLLSQRAWQRGEIGDADLSDEKYRLGKASESDPLLVATFPFAARALIDAQPYDADFLRVALYDQSHMIRELKLFAGTTPTRLRPGEGELARLIDQRSQLKCSINPLVADT